MHPLTGFFVPNATVALVCVASLLAVVLYLAARSFVLARARRRIPVRIHIGGTRGKSTLVRLVHEKLIAQGINAYGKVTGTTPRVLLPDGGERAIRRIGNASIREQESFVIGAARNRAEALIAECMAIRPELIAASEQKIFQSTVTAITNAWPDHLEDLGPDEDAMTQALLELVPVDGTLVIASEAMNEQVGRVAGERRCKVVTVPTEGVPPEEALELLAVAVCEAAGVAASCEPSFAESRKVGALRQGVVATLPLHAGGAHGRFIDAFTCNDAQSLAYWWERYDGAPGDAILLNARPDRPLRTRAMLQFLAERQVEGPVFIAGDPLAARIARRLGLSAQRLGSRLAPPDLLQQVLSSAGSSTTVWGIGNYRGTGARLSAHLRSRRSALSEA